MVVYPKAVCILLEFCRVLKRFLTIIAIIANGINISANAKRISLSSFLSMVLYRESLRNRIEIIFSIFVTFMFIFRMVLAGSNLQSSFIDGTAIAFLYDDEYGLTQDEVKDILTIIETKRNNSMKCTLFFCNRLT